jgi:chromosome segregation ATPase
MEADPQGEGAVKEGVDRLVAEIDRAVGTIERLRREAAVLEQRCQELQAKVDGQEKALGESEVERERLRADRDRLQKLYEQNASLIDNRGEIESKIEEMLSRLDTVNLD